MYKRILLPLDGSELAEQALPHALAQAERFQAELVLLTVFPPVEEAPGMWSPAVKQARERARPLAREYLERVGARVGEHGIPVQVVTVEGRPAMEITRYAEENQVDLIVLSTRGESGLSRWLMGSVADRVARGAKVPVLLVRAAKEKTYTRTLSVESKPSG
jgi:nucleotide-binding universal stress UspA family protein